MLFFPSEADPDASAFGPATVNASYEITSDFSATVMKTKDYSTDPEKHIVLDYFTVEKDAPVVGGIRQMKIGLPHPEDGALARLPSSS